MNRIQPALILSLASGGIAVVPGDDVVHLQPYANKRAMERAHLEHFERLVRDQHPSLSFAVLGEGADPPDFLISRGGEEIALELTVMASEERRQQAKFFSRLQDRVLQLHSRGRLQGLIGIEIEVIFGDLGGRPFKVSDDDLMNMVEGIEALKEKPWLLPNAKNMELPVEQLHPLGAGGEIAEGTVSWYVSGVADGRISGSPLSDVTGFDIVHPHRAHVTQGEFQDQVEAVVRKKDRTGNQELLITVGAPGLNGKAYPAEGVVADVLLRSWPGLREKPEHLRRVFIDSWSARQVSVIFDCDA